MSFSPIADPDSLQPSQRVAFDLIADHYEDVLAGLKPAQILVHVDWVLNPAMNIHYTVTTAKPSD
jgi:hypothetical protein